MAGELQQLRVELSRMYCTSTPINHNVNQFGSVHRHFFSLEGNLEGPHHPAYLKLRISRIAGSAHGIERQGLRLIECIQ